MFDIADVVCNSSITDMLTSNTETGGVIKTAPFRTRKMGIQRRRSTGGSGPGRALVVWTLPPTDISRWDLPHLRQRQSKTLKKTTHTGLSPAKDYRFYYLKNSNAQRSISVDRPVLKSISTKLGTTKTRWGPDCYLLTLPNQQYIGLQLSEIRNPLASKIQIARKCTRFSANFQNFLSTNPASSFRSIYISANFRVQSTCLSPQASATRPPALQTWLRIFTSHERQEAQLSQRGDAMLRVTEYFAKSLKVSENSTIR